MKIPRQIMIGGHVIDVDMTPARSMPMGNVGDMAQEHNRIRIREGLAESLEAETLLHEIIEFISANLEINLEHRDISTLASALFHTMRVSNINFAADRDEGGCQRFYKFIEGRWLTAK